MSIFKGNHSEIIQLRKEYGCIALFSLSACVYVLHARVFQAPKTDVPSDWKTMKLICIFPRSSENGVVP